MLAYMEATKGPNYWDTNHNHNKNTNGNFFMGLMHAVTLSIGSLNQKWMTMLS